ncbi:MAG: large conductance mechanosensitive channel protein MscL [Clostridiales bacterium]|jgi:large conductance mechanosensitive channel|nr:large conductance mechanosensitive channel protein MscL [Clostridiales bacterium]
MKKKKTKFFSDFKDFISKGNIIDLAVAVVIGGAFNKIVTSLVNDIIMPVISLIAGKVNVSDLNVEMVEATADSPAVTLNYGVFIQNVIDFLIVALTIFIILRAFVKLQNIRQLLVKNDKDKEAEEAGEEKTQENE